MNIGIIGAGTMGIGIAQVAATAGSNVRIFDIDKAHTERMLHTLDETLRVLEQKGKLAVGQSVEIRSRIDVCTDLKGLADSHVIIEAIIEDLHLKQELFKKLECIVSTSCILASNTSSISITSLATNVLHPERFIGIHFFNPAPIMPLVEVIPGLRTDEKCSLEVYEMIQTWRKSPVMVKDVPGFVVNRLARPFYGEALRIVEEQLASPQQVDDAMRSLGNFKMGPFELMDLIGIDVNFAVTLSIYNAYFYDPKYKPSLLQQRMTEARLLGRKTGKGFYSYAENSEPLSIEKDEVLYDSIFKRILSMLVNEAVEAKRLKIASDEDLEMAMQKGVNYPKGLLEWGREIGYETISKILDDLYTEYQEERYRQSPLLRKMANSTSQN